VFLQAKHTQKWEQISNTQSSTDTTNEDTISESDFRVTQNLNNKSRICGFGSEGLVMKEQLRRSTSARSSSVNNYDALEMAIRLNESVAKVAEDARQEELRRKIEAEVTHMLAGQFTRHLAETQAALEKKIQKQIKRGNRK